MVLPTRPRSALFAFFAVALLAPLVAAQPVVEPKPHDTNQSPSAIAPAKSATPDSASPNNETNDSNNDPSVVLVQGDRAPRGPSDIVRKRDQLKAAPHRTGSDLLLVVPGLFVTQHSGEGKAHQLFLRGFDAVHGQDIELWAGGAPVNEVSNLHGQGYADLHFIMPEVVSSILSTPGNYDPKQGDFAVAGTVRYELGYDEPGITAKATTGSFGSRRLFLGWHPDGAPEQTFAAFETYSTDGFGPARSAERTSAMGQVLFPLSSRIDLRIMASTFASRFDAPGVLRLSDIENRKVDLYGTYDPNQGGSSSRTSAVVELRGEQNPEGTERWSFSPFVVRRALKLRSNFTGYLLDESNGDSTQQINDSTTIGFNAYYRKPIKITSVRDTIEAGVFARNDWVSQSQRRLSQLDGSVTKKEVGAKIRATDAGGYLDFLISPAKPLRLRGGLRVDGLSYSTEDTVAQNTVGTGRTAYEAGQARSAQGAHVGKKATIDFSIIPQIRALLSYGEGFRSPQARSLSDGEKTPFTTVRSYELGIKYREQDFFETSLAAFHSTLSDDLVFDQSSARNEKVPGTVRNGLTADIVARPTRWFLSTSNITYTRAVFVVPNDSGVPSQDHPYSNGALLPYVPQLVTRSDMAFTPVLGEFWGKPVKSHFGAGITFLHNRPLPLGQMGRDVFLVDASASFRINPVELSLDIFNLLDSTWFDGQFSYASNFVQGANAPLVPSTHVTVGAPRTFLASVSLHL